MLQQLTGFDVNTQGRKGVRTAVKVDTDTANGQNAQVIADHGDPAALTGWDLAVDEQLFQQLGTAGQTDRIAALTAAQI